jgi:hypothetical protein
MKVSCAALCSDYWLALKIYKAAEFAFLDISQTFAEAAGLSEAGWNDPVSAFIDEAHCSELRLSTSGM